MDIREEYWHIVEEKNWSSAQHMNVFLEYVTEFNLAEHFLAYLKNKDIKPELLSVELIPSALIMQMVIRNKDIQSFIIDNALTNTDEIGWEAPSIIRCIKETLSIDININDTSILEELSVYFNFRHQKLVNERKPQKDTESQTSMMDMLTNSVAHSENNVLDDYFVNIEKTYKKK